MADLDDPLGLGCHGGQVENTAEIRILLDGLGWECREALVLTQVLGLYLYRSRSRSVGAPSAPFTAGWSFLGGTRSR
ncbi:hypothetical protein [Mycobacterium leprae]|uniref:hypothetical protein n=1 Tax=Mycobacterium leprae TaxID=1769 RepID=UPI0002E35117|nr:hypothetical protein [Mycobacterium leprae]